MGVQDWSKTAADNDDADSDINFAEGQAPSTVNNSARALMATVAEWRDDTGGALTTAGSSNAYTLTTNSDFSAYADGMRIHFVANHSNTGAATLNVDALGAKKIRKVNADGEGALASGDIISAGHYIAQYDASADAAAGAFILLNPVPITPADVGETIADATAKTTPVDADTMPLTDSAASSALKKVTWANIKATLKSYFDTLYYIVGGTDVSLADGGTGASLSDPGADRIMFWDDSAGSTAYLTASTGLEISGTSMTVRAASESQTGIVELATTAEAEAGSDTSRAVTPAGVKAYVDANPSGWTYLTGSTTWDLPAMSANDIRGTTVTVTGAAVGDFAIASNTSGDTDLSLSANVASSNTVVVNALASGSVSFSAGTTLRVVVIPKSNFGL